MSAQTVTVVLSTGRDGKCRSCQADVTWYKTQAGKWLPFNGAPTPQVQQELLADDSSIGFLPASAAHWTTCPDADAWRKKR
jgi:hypothetical protein